MPVSKGHKYQHQTHLTVPKAKAKALAWLDERMSALREIRNWKIDIYPELLGYLAEAKQWRQVTRNMLIQMFDNVDPELQFLNEFDVWEIEVGGRGYETLIKRMWREDPAVHPRGGSAARRQALPTTGQPPTRCAILAPLPQGCGNRRVWRWLRATT